MIYYIGIHGPKRVGKDILAKHLVRNLGPGVHTKRRVVIDRLADPLYHFAASISGWTTTRLMGSEKDSIFGQKTHNISIRPFTPRQVLLNLGVHVRDTYGMGFLNDCLKQRSKTLADTLPDHYNLVVIVPDVRTEIEASMMHIVFDVHREGCAFEGGLTEHELQGIDTVRVQAMTVSDPERYDPFDTAEIVRTHLHPLFLKES